MSQIARDLDSLPRVEPSWEASQTQSQDWMPDTEPDLAPILAQAWFEKWGNDRHLPPVIPEAGPLRGSNAANCARALAYGLTKTEQSDPMTIADFHRMRIGTTLHDQYQAQYKELFPEALIEHPVDLRHIGMSGSARMDLVVPDTEHQGFWRPVELKSINGTGFKAATVGLRKGEGPSGPRDSALVQMCMAAAALNAEGKYPVKRGTVINLSLELIGADLAARIGLGGEVDRFAAQWTVPIEKMEEIGLAEAKRQEGILNKLLDSVPGKGSFDELHLADPTIIRRVIPGYGEVANPAKGFTVSGSKAKKAWHCDYCPWQAVCMFDKERGR